MKYSVAIASACLLLAATLQAQPATTGKYTRMAQSAQGTICGSQFANCTRFCGATFNSCVASKNGNQAGVQQCRNDDQVCTDRCRAEADRCGSH
jgi:hypothetical protein